MKGRIAFIVEGRKREHKILEKIQESFPFNNIDIIELTMENNIYNLYCRLEKDDFSTDIIEVLREIGTENPKQLEGLSVSSFQEIYLFFDFDFQEIFHREGWTAQQACDIIIKLLNTFDNETELGKMYISYPMVEAFFDMNTAGCIPATFSCSYPIEHRALKAYKKKVNKANPRYMDINTYDKEDWRRICSSFIHRCFCLMNKHDEPSLSMYKSCHAITPADIFKNIRNRIISKQENFILSAIPEFLLDYFKIEHMNPYFIPYQIHRFNPDCSE